MTRSFAWKIYKHLSTSIVDAQQKTWDSRFIELMDKSNEEVFFDENTTIEQISEQIAWLKEEPILETYSLFREGETRPINPKKLAKAVLMTCASDGSATKVVLKQYAYDVGDPDQMSPLMLNLKYVQAQELFKAARFLLLRERVSHLASLQLTVARHSNARQNETSFTLEYFVPSDVRNIICFVLIM